MLIAAEQELEEVKVKIKQAKRESRIAEPMEDQKQAAQDVQKLNRLQRSKREELFDTEDEIEAKRDETIPVLEKQMHQQSTTQYLFKIRWQIA